MSNRSTYTTHKYSTTGKAEPPLATPLIDPLSIQTAQRLAWQISEDYYSKANTSRSRRKRFSQLTINDFEAPANHTTVDDNCSANIIQNRRKCNRLKRPAFSYLNAVTTISRYHLTTLTVYIVLFFFIGTCSICTASPCDSQSWWDPVKDKCISCTVCQGEMIPLRPCQLHRDTICGSIYDLKIDWVVLAKTEPNWKERRKSEELDMEQQLTPEELLQLHEESISLDWQTGALFIAVLACLLFFIVAACILMQHMKQWRRMERRLDQDVEELSTKLMAKLAEVQSIEGGTFFIGNADALRVPTTFQPQHVLLPEKSVKQHERRLLKTLQPGNVYIEENGSKG
ncbi:tumor necrosis factor receptor superfamily member wengen [Teleopsis dalmanni]|uniref:tumor necrosis factor receptor superfamily member wengen n=1 Tax=Teleopsis dalmanni TaxID=139649 RepID=UPI0018CF7DD8|nr:tumor necrosis factor receptor superfamily member wengen [Teleopsis dalmanni]XP_037938805.1 tumor necrosis factor receptor superfamily member wengen [Teleopsis dalmanni]